MPLIVRPKYLSSGSKSLIDEKGSSYSFIGKGKAKVLISPTVGLCIHLDGDVAIELDPKTLVTENEITISFWANPDTLAQNAILIQSLPTPKIISSHAIGIFLPWDKPPKGAIAFHCPTGKDGNDNLTITYTEDDLPEKKWHHWVFTKDVLKGEMCIYRDGTLWRKPLKAKLPIKMGGTLSIGNAYDPNYKGFIGSLAKVELRDYALTPAQISNLYDGTIKKTSTELNPDKIDEQTLYDEDKKQTFPIVGDIGTPSKDKKLGNIFGNSLSFGQTKDQKGYIELPRNAINDSGEITIMYWAKPKASDKTNVILKSIVKIGDTQAESDAISNLVTDIQMPWVDTDEKKYLVFRCGNDGTKADMLKFELHDDELAINQWTHWAFTKSFITGEMNIYRNGVLWNTGDSKQPDMLRRFKPAGLIALGADTDKSAHYHGELAKFSIKNHILSQDEIIAAMVKPITSAEPEISSKPDNAASKEEQS